MNLGGPELIIVLIIILVLFGGAKLPKLARSLGQAQKEFRDGVKEAEELTEEWYLDFVSMHADRRTLDQQFFASF